MFRRLFAWIQKYERHLSALAMVAGFVVDNVYFDRIDVARTELLFAAYALACALSILWLHRLETTVIRGRPRPRWRSLLPIATQFALGGFWSGFLIFYARSAALSASWPFLLLLFAVFLGNEYFARYHDRLVFTNVLFFLALYSYAIFAVPIYTGSLGEGTFLLSGAAAIGVFALFTMLLRLVGKERLKNDIWRIRAGALTVLALMNVFYFTNILPPLPLSAKAAGIYHEVTRVPGGYTAVSEAEPWEVAYLGFTPTIHLVSGDALYAYAAVFAPTTLSTTIVHRWQWYDEAAKQWVTRATVPYPIAGGRDGGYRGYSAIVPSVPGRWRASIETSDGRVIARLPATVVFVAGEPPLTRAPLLK